MVHTVIARYKEDVDWAEGLPNTFIYNKHGGSNLLPNIGREAHTYLHHILAYYENLPEMITFLQGDPRDHFNINEIQYKEKKFYGKEFLCFGDGRPHHLGLDVSKFAVQYNLLQDSYLFKAGANFTVSKQDILKHSKEFYISLYIKTLTDPQTPYILERLWRYIF